MWVYPLITQLVVSLLALYWGSLIDMLDEFNLHKHFHNPKVILPYYIIHLQERSEP